MCSNFGRICIGGVHSSGQLVTFVAQSEFSARLRDCSLGKLEGKGLKRRAIRLRWWRELAREYAARSRRLLLRGESKAGVCVATALCNLSAGNF